MISVAKKAFKVITLMVFNISPFLSTANSYIDHSKENISKFFSYFETTDKNELDGLCAPAGAGFCFAYRTSEGVTKKVLHYNSATSTYKDYPHFLSDKEDRNPCKGKLSYYFPNLLDLSSNVPLHLKFTGFDICCSTPKIITMSINLIDENGNHRDFGYKSLEVSVKNNQYLFFTIINQGGKVSILEGQYAFDMSKIKCIEMVFHYSESTKFYEESDTNWKTKSTSFLKTDPEMAFNLEDINIVSEEELAFTNDVENT